MPTTRRRDVSHLQCKRSHCVVRQSMQAKNMSRSARRPVGRGVVVLMLLVLPAWVVFVGYETSVFQATGVWHEKQSSARKGNNLALFVSGAQTSLDKSLELGSAVATDQHASVYPEAIYDIDWSTQVSRRDVLHLGALQRACTTYPESAILSDVGLRESQKPWTDNVLNRTMDSEKLLAKLRQCPPVDIYLPTGLRRQGYCEDGASYTKYLHARMLPRWVMEIELFDKQLNRSVTYHELCPRTPMLFFNHYWDGLRDDATWPNTKPLYLMPNIEMYELEAKHYWQVDVILCKTAICAQYLSKWFEQEGNPHMTQVLYTRFTTSDMATNALVASGEESVDGEWAERVKDFASPVFVHTAGSSAHKGSRYVLDCWLSRADLPPLEFYMSEDMYNDMKSDYDERIRGSSNVKLHVGSVDALSFGKMIAESAFFLCTSVMEGYGHYINHARASGGVIVTPDVPPMNELVTPSSGVMVDAKRGSHKSHFLGGGSRLAYSLRGLRGYVAKFGGEEVCEAVDDVLKNMSAKERSRRAHRVRQQYFYDTAFFATAMQQARKRLEREKD